RIHVAFFGLVGVGIALVGGGLRRSQRELAASAASVRASEQHLAHVLDTLTAFVGVCTPDGRLVQVNRSALQAAGLRPDGVLGRPLWEASWWVRTPSATDKIRQAVERGARGESSRFDLQ